MHQAVMLPSTDANGTTAMELPAGPMALRILPAHLQSSNALTSQLMMQGGWAAFDTLWIPLGIAEVAVGSTTAIELRLPADWSH
jgi:hypothetical protein